MIELDAVGKTYPGAAAPAVTSLDLVVTTGEIVALVGPSGCGKTTTLKMINRLIEPSRGTIRVAGRDIGSVPGPELRRGIGYVIQHTGLFPHRTIAENIATVPRMLGWERGTIARRIGELVELMGLDPAIGTRYPAELSGGQRQRVGVARALAADPPVLLMDEPFGAVDPILRSRLQDELLALQRRLHKTIVLVTHDIDEAIKVADRVAILNIGGVLEQYAPPGELLRAPANAFVEDFLGADRGIKRLSLIRIAEVPLEAGPVVAPGAGAAEVAEAMRRYGVDWFGVVSGSDLLGWAWGSEAPSGAGGVALRPFEVRLQGADTLRDALDTAITGRTLVAPVFDGERYLGMLTVDAISRQVIG
ncbi:MAG: ABC transporter ATP-binding protein [Acidimicrobiia bacterium]|nr:ABC transporter ATP-binding protein [Acidimicrobiia bacterium]